MFNEPQMTELPAEKQAAKAIAHTLRNISERPGVAWYLGHGTQTYALLTEALGTLSNKMMAEIQSIYPPADQPNFDDRVNTCPFCGSSYISRCQTHHEHAFQCQDCEAIGPEADTEDEAREKWNARKMPR